MKEKNVNGITLIALVITIIVLLILAGVTIVTLTGDNGLLTKASNAQKATSEAKLTDEVAAAMSEYEIEKYTNPNADIKNNIKEIFEKIHGTGNITVTKSGKNYKAKVKDTKTAYKVKYDGKVEQYEEMDTTNIYGKFEDGIVYLRATEPDGYDEIAIYNGSYSLQHTYTAADIEKVIIEEPIAPKVLRSFFSNCENLESIENIENLHTENSKDLSSMFNNCKSLKELDLSHFDTTNANIGYMFTACENLEKVDFSNLDTSHTDDFGLMFYHCYKLKKLDLSGFDSSNVTHFQEMFDGCSSAEIIDIRNFDMSSCTGEHPHLYAVFYNVNPSAKIYINQSTLDKLKQINPNDNYSNFILVK